MYEEFYQLDGRPFISLPDPDFLVWTESHMLAFTMLRYGVMMRAPITVVTGEIGAGKTTLLRKLLGEIPNTFQVGLISNMQASRGELLHWVLMALGRKPSDAPYVTLFQEFRDLVIDAYASGRRVLLIFDEAQNLSIDQLEELRMLSNINSEKDDLLQLILVGQPQLRDTLGRPELEQFVQRISSDFHLNPMSVDEVIDYIQRRLDRCGARWRIFTDNACRLVYEATRGVPRLVNILCDLCLVYGFSAEKKIVDEAIVREFLGTAQKRGIYRQFTSLPETPTLVRTTRG